MPVPSALFAVVALALFAAGATWVQSLRRRRRLVEAIKDGWGRAHDRPFHTETIAALFHSRLQAEGGRDCLDSRTWNDLDLDNVVQALDRTEGTLGQQALYYRVRTSWTPEELHTFDALVERMTTDVEARQRAQLSLAALRDPDGYDVWWIAQPGVLDRQPWHVVYPLLSAMMVLLLISASVWPAAMFPLLAGALVNIFIRGITARRLIPLLGPFRQAASVISAAQSLAFLGDKDGDVPRLQRLHGFLRWTGRDSASSGEVASLVLDYLNMMFLIDVNAAYFAAAEVQKHAQSLFRVAHNVGEIDAAISVASYRAGAAVWTKPSFVAPGARASMKEVRHPLLENPVPNSLEWSPPNGFLVTGSNMSGKTTFIRTVGVNAVLARTIHTSLATRWEAPMLRVRSCIARTDDLLAGKSYYLVEVEAVLGLVHASASDVPHLLLFDELFRGTNAVERVSAAAAVLTEILDEGGKRKPHLVLAATHDAELIEWLSESYAACHLGDELGPDGIVFTYQLRAGPATTRNAIALLQLHGAPPALVTRALERAAWLDRQRERLTTAQS